MPEHTSLQQIRTLMALHVCLVTLIAVEQVNFAYACMPCTVGPQACKICMHRAEQKCLQQGVLTSICKSTPREKEIANAPKLHDR